MKAKHKAFVIQSLGIGFWEAGLLVPIRAVCYLMGPYPVIPLSLTRSASLGMALKKSPHVNWPGGPTVAGCDWEGEQAEGAGCTPEGQCLTG
jgi:hypothetical protein